MTKTFLKIKVNKNDKNALNYLIITLTKMENIYKKKSHSKYK